MNLKQNLLNILLRIDYQNQDSFKEHRKDKVEDGVNLQHCSFSLKKIKILKNLEWMIFLCIYIKRNEIRRQNFRKI